MKFKLCKTISIIIAAVMLVTSGIVFSRTMSAEAEDTVLQQYDAEWRSYPYGDGNLGNSGCGALAIINAVKYLTGNTMDIYAVADWGSANEYIAGVGSSFTIAPNAAAQFGSQYGFQLDTHYGFSGYVGNCYPADEAVYDAAWDTLVAKLSAGEVAVGLVHNHFIAIVDYDSATDRVLVYDPGAGSKRETTKSGDWKTYDELNYWSEEGTTYLKLRAYLTFYFATGTASKPAVTTAAPEFEGTPGAAGTYIVNTDGSALNMRSTPSTSGVVLTTIPSGAEVQVIESDGTWASVSYGGVSGYCSMEYLTPASETTTAVTEASTTTTTETTILTTTAALSEEYAGTYIVSANGSYLNMRTGPATSYDIAAQIPDETEVIVTAADGVWAAVTWNGNSGYCSMAYLEKLEDTDLSVTVTTTAATAAATTTTTAATSASETDASAVTSTTTTSASAAVSTTAATTASSDVSAVNKEAGAYAVDTDGAHLNLRAAGSAEADILAQIPNESEVFVISINNGWANVSWNSITGYCSAKYLTRLVIDAEQSTESITGIDPAYVTVYGDANLDGRVEMADIVLLHKALTGAISLNKTAAANSDCYTDSTLNMVDVTVIIQSIISNCDIPIKPVL